MAGSGLSAEPLDSHGVLNWIYLIWCIVDGILCLAFLFYFNRLFGTAVSYIVRLFLWRKYRIYIDIQALQISPLAGRIFFKGIRYHGENVTVLVHDGYITWRYWYPKVKGCQAFSNLQPPAGGIASEPISKRGVCKEEVGNGGRAGRTTETPTSQHAPKKIPCRISIKVSGVEGFLYNRGPSYDAILDLLKQHGLHDESPSTTLNEKVGHCSLDPQENSQSSPAVNGASYPGHNVQQANPTQRHESTTQGFTFQTIEPPAFLRLLPIGVEATTGALVLGNDNTKSIITAKFETASGEFNASRSGPLDLFKILMSFDIVHPYIQMKPNVDYKQPQLTEATNLKDNLSHGLHDLNDTEKEGGKRTRWTMSEKFSHLPHPHDLFTWPNGSSASVLDAKHKSGKKSYASVLPSPPPSRSMWLGLSRYLDDSQDEHLEWDLIEYANSSVLADIGGLGFKMFWDIPGTVQPIYGSSSETANNDINGAMPPEYGIELVVRGGLVNYGPWADRHRLNIQQIFFPASFADAIPAAALKIGETRISTILNLKVIVEDDVTLRIPFREPSKDWKWKGRASTLAGRGKVAHRQVKLRSRRRKSSMLHRKRASAASGTDIRPFAWFDITVKSNSVISYDSDMIARRSGYGNTLGVNVSGIEIGSSLNHALLWRSGRVTISSDLSNPLRWNAVRTWTFDISIHALDFFLLRDHTFMLMDLIQDWGSGPLQDFLTFVPVRYVLNVHFHNFKLYLNTNDANIINNSEDIDDNEFVILYGRLLDAELGIPMHELRPVSKDITFDVLAHDLGFELCMPPRNTLSTLLLNKDVAQLSSVELHGIYTSCSEVAPGMIDTLHMEIVGRSFTIAFYGFLARHLIKVKENYFGDSVHFTTLEEYHDLKEREASGIPIERAHPVVNALDVILDIRAENVNILLPANLYASEEHIRIHVDNTDVDLRVNDFYLELMVDSTPLQFSYSSIIFNGLSQNIESSNTQLFLDGVKVFGHRLFGSTYSNPVYVSNWDVQGGSINGQCDTAFVQKLIAAGQALAVTISDAENAQSVDLVADLPDSTFVRFLCPAIRIWCHIDGEALLLSAGTIEGSFTDWASTTFSQRLQMTVPDITVACVDGSQIIRQLNNGTRSVVTHAHVSTSIAFEMVRRNIGFEEQRKIQHTHIQTQDNAALRAQFLVPKVASHTYQQLHVEEAEVPALPLPALPGLLVMDIARLQHPVSPNRPQGSNARGTALKKDYTPLLERKTDQGYVRDSPAPCQDTQGIFASVFRPPYFSLSGIVPDLTNVPRLDHAIEGEGLAGTIVDDVRFEETYDDAVHTTFIVTVNPGISVLCTPEAVRTVAVVLDRVSPRDPKVLLDDFQTRTVMEVLSSYSKKNGTNSVTDLRVSVLHMHVRFINKSFMDANGEVDAPSDRYNMIANDSIVTCRFKCVPQRQNEADSTSAHAKMGYLAVSAQEGSNEREAEDAALQLVIDDILLWLVDSDHTSVNAAIQHTKVAMASTKVEYLAKLIHRTTMLVDDLEALFVTVLAQPENRLQYLVHSIVRLGHTIPDPAFLTRPSFIIRANPNHIRNSDSWKILSKLRHVYQNLSKEEHERMRIACLHDDVTCPPDSEFHIMNTLNSWRNWDSVMVNDSAAMRVLYASSTREEKLHGRGKIPLGLAVQSRRFKVVIDPGPKPNKFSVHDLVVRLSIRPPSPPSALAVFQDYDEKRSTTVQVHSSKLALTANWKICGLVDHILTLFERRAPGHHGLEIPQPPRDMTAEPNPLGVVHIVVAADVTKAKIATIHLQQQISCHALRISVAGENWSGDANDMWVNAVFAAKETSAEMRGHNKLLWQGSIKAPNVWVAYSRSVMNESWLDTLRMAADSETVTFQMKEEILGILELANSVISDEAAYIYRLATVHANAGAKISGTAPVVRNRLPPHIDLAMFLNMYQIDISLLDDLHYSANGRIARLFIVPDSQLQSTYQVGFDLKSQTHRLLSSRQLKLQTIAEVGMPPINGTLRLLRTEEIVTISASVIVEKIAISAGAIYGLLNTVGSTKVRTAAESVQADWETVSQTILKTFPTGTASKAVELSDTPTPLVFDVSLVLAGFLLSAAAPSSSGQTKASEVLFSVQSIYARAANRSADDTAPLPFPELRVAIREVRLQLRSKEDDQYKDCGNLTVAAFLNCTVERDNSLTVHRRFHLSITGPFVEIFAETVPTAARIVAYLQSRLKGLHLRLDDKYLRRLRHLDRPAEVRQAQPVDEQSNVRTASSSDSGTNATVSSFSFDLQQLQISYAIRDSVENPISYEEESLTLTLEAMNLLARNEEEARLSISNLQLALVPVKDPIPGRPRNSALLPEVVFNVRHKATKTERKLAFHAAGKALDISLEPQFILPASDIERSIRSSNRQLKEAAASIEIAPSSGPSIPMQQLFGGKTLSSLLLSAQFAGAVVRIHGKDTESRRKSSIVALHLDHIPQHGRYGQFSGDDTTSNATLRAPGISFRVQYQEAPSRDPFLNVAIRIDASSNVIYPAVVPLILQISNSVKQIVRDPEPVDQQPEPPKVNAAQKFIGEDVIIAGNASAILGKMRLNFGMQICKQEFSLSCQPIAKVAATAKIEDIYIMVNSVHSSESESFLAASAKLKGLSASLRHVYSREGTFNFGIDSIIISLMNSKHFSGVGGISAILKIDPSRAQINAKQLQDVLLFREIWLPPEIRNPSESPESTTVVEPQDYFVQRYKKIAETTAFPWHATVTVAELAVELDLGQAIGRSSLRVRNLWASSKKTTSSQQNLCIGLDEISMRGSGRLGSLIALEKVEVRSSIAWPFTEKDKAARTPLVQASVGFQHLQVKAAFDYQAFAIADVTNFGFIMYNVRDPRQESGDRLVAILDGDKVNAYCIASAAASAVSLYQAFDRLAQERVANYQQSLQEIEKFLRRKASAVPSVPHAERARTALTSLSERVATLTSPGAPQALHTDVVVTLRYLDFGVFPSTLMDHQIFKADASDVQARFAVVLRDNKTHSGLGLTLGQLRVSLATVPHNAVPKSLNEVTVEEVLANAASGRGGIILRVPKVHATMQTWQPLGSTVIDYIFKSIFEGKIDVGWNYSRISFIRGMWSAHTRTLASRLGKPLPESAVKIHGAPQPSQDPAAIVSPVESKPPTEQQKITAVVNLPQSKYTYNALEPPIIDTPQLRDMGEATPPLEWVGLQRDKLPHVTHQIVIVTLLQIAKEVEDAYGSILGSA